MNKPKVAFFDFSCCEGCQLQVANLGESLLDLLGVIDVVEFREVMSERIDGQYDVAVIEGSITTPHQAELVKKIRERSKIIIAYGSCATIGGVNGMKNNFDLKDIRQYVYGKDFEAFPTVETRAVHQVVKVDYFVPGCPVYPPEFLEVLKAILLNVPYQVPDISVCVECKFNGNVCMYDRGITCLGPVTRAGCNSWCINNNNICYGCRGMVTNPAENAMKQVLDMYHIPMDFVMNKMNMYNKCRELNGNGQKS
jgi:sulfhydrogenase subunit delta